MARTSPPRSARGRPTGRRARPARRRRRGTRPGRPAGRRRGRCGRRDRSALRIARRSTSVRALGEADRPPSPTFTASAFTSRASQAISSEAKTGPSRQTRCGVPVTPMTTQPRQAPTAQPMFCSIETCRKALRRAAGEPTRIGPAGAALPAELGHAEPGPRGPRRAAPGRASIGCGPQAKAWSAQRLVVGDELGDEAVVAERAVVGRDDVLDLVGQQARRVDLACADAAPNRSVTWRPSRIASSASIRTPAMPEAAGDQQQVAAARVDLERAGRAARACRAGHPAGAG